MTLAELDQTLPNGLHDAEVRTVLLDFVSRVATFDLEVWIGDLEAPLAEGRETYRPATLELRGIGYFTIEPPDPRYPFDKGKAIKIDLCDADPAAALPPTKEAQFASRFFVNEWNAFISVSATHAELRWTAPPYNAFARRA